MEDLSLNAYNLSGSLEEILDQFSVYSTFEELALTRVTLFSNIDDRRSLERLVRNYSDAIECNDVKAIINADKLLSEQLNTISKNEILKSALEPYQVIGRLLYSKYYGEYCPNIRQLNASKVDLMTHIISGEFNRFESAYEAYKKCLLNFYYNNQEALNETIDQYICG